MNSLNGGYLSGKIDEIIIENREWSQTEIKNKYSYYRGFF